MIPAKYRIEPATEYNPQLPIEPPPSALRGVFEAILRHRLLLAFCILGCFALGVAYTYRAVPVYEASAMVRFEAERLDLPELVQLPYTENLINTEMEVLRGRQAAAATIDSLGLRATLVKPRRVQVSQLFSVLHVAPAADSGTLVFRSQGNGDFVVTRPDSAHALGVAHAGDTARFSGVLVSLTPDAKDVPKFQLHIDLLDVAVRRFGSALQLARPSRDADLIAISFRDSDPKRAAAAANYMAHNLIEDRSAARRGRTSAAVSFLEQQDDSLGRQLRAAEESLREYQQREHVIDVPQQASAEVTRLAKLQADLAGVRAERDAFAALVSQLKNDTSGTLGGKSISRRLMAFPSLLANQSASVLLGSMAQVETERSQLLIHRTSNDSDVQVLTARIHEMESQLQGIAESYLQSLSDQVTSLDAENQRFSTQLDALPEKELQTARRQRDTKVLNDLWVLVQTRLKEAQMTGAGGDPTVRIADLATAPLSPIRPRPMINLALSLIFGSLLGVSAVLLRDYSDGSVRSRADAQSAVGIPVIGAFPKLRVRRNVAPLLRPIVGNIDMINPHRVVDPVRNRTVASIASLLVTEPDASPAYIESFNQLFVNLQLSHHEKPLKTVVFTSALPGEGKSLSAINYALVAASRGLRVLLIDADLRCGVVSSVLGIKQTPGFAEVLAGKATFTDAAHQFAPGQHRSLVVLPSGALPRVPGRVLTVERVRAVLDSLEPDFDMIVIDTPPINLLADAALLGTASDAVMLVVRVGHTQVNDLRYAIDQLDSTGAPVIGTLLNDIDLRKNSRDDGSYRYLAEAARYNVSSV
jgi:capsular exopolysaccharide synthesis family protein